MSSRFTRQAGTRVACAASGATVGRILSAFLYGVPAIDPLTAAAVVIAAAWCAAIVPARRAGRVSPAEVLRQA